MVKNKIELWVERIVAGGTGLANLNGWKVFVPYAAPQERIIAQIVLKKKDYGIARIEDILEPSPFRVPPRCSYYGKCGGCQLQHLTYEAQLAVKRQLVKEALQRIGKIFVSVPDINFKSSIWRYRNKTQYPIAGDSKKFLIGFYRPKTHRIIEVTDCHLHPEEFNLLRERTLDAFLDAGEVPFNELKHQGNIRHLVLRRGTNGETLLIVVTRTKELKSRFVDKLKRYPSICGIIHNINPTPSNRIFGDTSLVHWGRKFITVKILQKELRVSAASFFQVNQRQTEELCNKVIKAIEPHGDETVLDLYCGVGMFSLVLANQVRRVIGIEIVPEAIEDARFNASNLGIRNVEFIPGDVNHLIHTIQDADIVIVDPPRKGCTAETIHQIATISPRMIVYVSCNPATLARDLALLARLNYNCISIELLDMFPQTAHVEVIAKVIRKSTDGGI